MVVSHRSSFWRILFFRLVQFFLSLVSVATLVFFLLRVLPGGPFDEVSLSGDVEAQLKSQFGFGESLLSQYWVFMGNLLRGELGESYYYEGRSVLGLISQGLPTSLHLGTMALVLALFFGILLGLFAAFRSQEKIGRCLHFFSMAGISMPSFFLAPILVLFFSFGWPFYRIWPDAFKDFHGLPSALWESPWHWILPVVTLSLRPMCYLLRLTRTTALEILDAPHVQTTRAKGISNFRLLTVHVLKNAMLPIVTFTAPLAAQILTGSFVVEVIFQVPGLSQYFIQGIFHRDYPLVGGLTIIYTFFLVLANLLADVSYQWIDPRVKEGL